MARVRNRQEDDASPQFRMVEAAIAVLVERIASLDQGAKDDLAAVWMEIPKCETEEDLKEVEQTLRELIFPMGHGGLVEGALPPSQGGADALRRWASKIGEKIKQFREAKRMTQDELAKASGLLQSHISRLENGQHSPSHKTVTAIAMALGVAAKDIDPGCD